MITPVAGWPFSRKVGAAVLLLAAFVMVQGAVSTWIAGVAEQRVLRGRIAGDLQAGFVELSATKQRLKAWSLEVLLGTVPAANDGERLSGALIARADDLKALGERAARFDAEQSRSGGSINHAMGVEHAARAATLATLRASFVRLRTAVLGLDAISPTANPLNAWQSLERIFDVAGDENLADLLQKAVARETLALAQKRVAADMSLARLRAVAWGATAFILALALVLAVVLARALRRPLAEMAAGTAALQRGDLAHRIPVRSGDEFGLLANSVNAMSEELLARRKQEAMTRDILEKRVEEQTRHLQEALADLHDSQERRRRLIADISHELRTPTTAIRGEAEIALRARNSDEAQHRMTLVRIGDAARHLGSVIDDLLTLARSDADTLTLSHEPVELGRIITDMVSQASAGAALRHVPIIWKPPAQPLSTEGDPQRLRQLIGILLDNAIRYSHPGQTVTIEADPRQAEVDVVITDRGIGIEPDDLAHVFERQYRAHNARKHRPDGTGLGLGLARELAHRHGGDIALASDGSGTRATLTLPLKPSMDEVIAP